MSRTHFQFFQSKVLSEDRKTHFEEEIKTLSGALKAQYDQANKEYAGIFRFCLISFKNLISDILYYFPFDY